MPACCLRDGLSSPVGADGRFYFKTAPAGEYFLVAEFTFPGRNNQAAQVYYPGVNTREKATRIRIPGRTRSDSFDFDARAIPLVPLPIFVESPDPSHRISVVVLLLDSGGHAVNQLGVSTGNPSELTVIRGETYDISVLDSASYRKRSETVRVTAASGMTLTRMALTRRE